MKDNWYISDVSYERSQGFLPFFSVKPFAPQLVVILLMQDKPTEGHMDRKEQEAPELSSPSF